MKIKYVLACGFIFAAIAWSSNSSFEDEQKEHEYLCSMIEQGIYPQSLRNCSQKGKDNE